MFVHFLEKEKTEVYKTYSSYFLVIIHSFSLRSKKTKNFKKKFIQLPKDGKNNR